MTTATDDPLSAAGAALAAGDWSTARTAFEDVLEREPCAEALLGLGSALWWLGETDASVRCQERAYAEFRRRPDPVQAAMTAIGLCLLYRASLGNYTASRGWLERLARLVDDNGLEPLTGWVSLCRAVTANDSSDPSVAEPWAREAAEVARRTDDADLELCSLTELGTALVQRGKTEDGAALLDEAMAGGLAGETLRLETVVFIACRAIISCSRASDVKRAVEWVRAGDDFSRRYGGLHLYTVCRVHYGNLLFQTGKWNEAEKELRAALRIGKNAERSLYGEALASLAELRLAQGKIVEATSLLSGFEDHPAAAHVLAAVHLARAEPAVAAGILRSRLDGFTQPCLEGSPVAELLCEVEVELGEIDEGTSRAHELATLGTTAGCEVITARGRRALGIALAAGGDEDTAVGHLHRAVHGFDLLDMPFESGRTHLVLANVLAQREPGVAVAQARAALAAFERLGAAPGADAAAALLRSLGVKVARGGRSADGALTRREREVLELLGEGLSNRELAERLVLSRKTVEHHVASVLAKLQLSSRAEAAVYAVRHPAGSSPTREIP